VRVRPFEIAGVTIRARSKKRFEIPIARIPSGANLAMPMVVAHGGRPGPVLLIDAALHGDEINGMDIILRVVHQVDPKNLAGTIIAVPIVNVFGFLYQSRYLPDRRDLNRSFPGSQHGSLAARLAHQFTTQAVDRCNVIIDLHTGSLHRANLPQIRANLNDAPTRELAAAFGAPIMMHSKPRDGSLRLLAQQRGIPCLVYEAAEPHRFDSVAVNAGVDGVFRVLRHLGMYEREREPEPYSRKSLEIRSTSWIRAGRSGILLPEVELGEIVEKKQVLGTVTDALGAHGTRLHAPFDGVVLGMQLNPLVYRGDALFHLAQVPEVGWSPVSSKEGEVSSE